MRDEPHFLTFQKENQSAVVVVYSRPSMPSHQKKRSSPKKLAKQQQPKMTYTAQQLAEAADQAMHMQDPTQALNLYTAAVVQATEQALQVDILEKRAAVKVSLADQDGALEDYKAALHLLPPQPTDVNDLERKAGLFMYMGQLSQGEEALIVYRQALELLEKALPLRQDDPKALAETRQQLATACCTTAELFLTDLCFEENAEQDCESYIQQALKLLDSDGEPIVDALQTCASLKLSQNKGLEATDYILRAFAKIRVGCESLAALVEMRESENPDEATELLETEAVQKLPGFEFRCQTAKLLMECASVQETSDADDHTERRTQCLRAAVDVLGSLMAENDEVVEVWALAGDAFNFLEPSAPNAAHYWERAVEMLTSVKGSLEEQRDETEDDEEEDELNQELEEVLGQLESLQEKLSKVNKDTVDEE